MSVCQLLCKSSQRAVNIWFMLYPQRLKLLNTRSFMFNISSINIGWMNRYLQYFVSVYSGHGAAPFRFPPGYSVVGWQPSAAAPGCSQTKAGQGRQGEMPELVFPSQWGLLQQPVFSLGFPISPDKAFSTLNHSLRILLPEPIPTLSLSQVSDLHCDLSSLVYFCSLLLFIPHKELPH